MIQAANQPSVWGLGMTSFCRQRSLSPVVAGWHLCSRSVTPWTPVGDPVIASFRSLLCHRSSVQTQVLWYRLDVQRSVNGLWLHFFPVLPRIAFCGTEHRGTSSAGAPAVVIPRSRARRNCEDAVRVQVADEDDTTQYNGRYRT